MRIKLETQNIHFSSDFHESHSNIILYDKRPFKNIEEMNAKLIINWNNKVKYDDIVFYLGDLSLSKDIGKIKNFVNQLNGKIHFVMGNHDDERVISKIDRFESVSDYINLNVRDEDNSRKYQGIIMSHYPILSWDKAHRSNWMLHGHSHQSLINYFPEFYKRKVIDVGCNGHNYTPLSYQEIKDIMKTKVISAVDHHEAK
jgi:calcineurin-like phosphoesterase family protein